MEKYKIEYLTTNNEPDKPFHEQNWSVQEESDNIADFLVATNTVARKEFKGKLINKITQAEKHTDKVIAASLTNVDIAGLDVGPPMDAHTTLQTYKEAFSSYQYYATLAAKAGVPWMNGEYWQGDFDNGYSDFATFSLPQGETTQKALTDFLSKI